MEEAENGTRTLKYCPASPTQPFVDLDAARAWVTAFVTWYNHSHQHSAIHFVTPDDRIELHATTILTLTAAGFTRRRSRLERLRLGGQFPMAFPDQDMVAVMNGWNILPGARQLPVGRAQERLVRAVR